MKVEREKSRDDLVKTLTDHEKAIAVDIKCTKLYNEDFDTSNSANKSGNFQLWFLGGKVSYLNHPKGTFSKGRHDIRDVG